MSRKRTSLDAIMSRAVEAPPPQAEPAAPVAKPMARKREEAPAKKADEPGIRKHTAYLKVPVYEQIRRLAFEERKKMHDYLIEGLDLVFRKRGLPSVAELDARLEKESK